MENVNALNYPIPFDEDYRLQVLHELNILDTEKQPEFDRLVILASKYFSTKMALVSLVDKDRQWLKSACGVNVTEMPRDASFCTHSVAKRRPLLVLDATEDSRFYDNDLVTGPPHIRFYAGFPIFFENAAIGSFCIIDDKPRDSFSEEDQAALKNFTEIVQDQIKLFSITRSNSKTAAEALQSSKRLAKAGTLAKKQFLALMSHELRTPLNAVIGFADVIHNELLGPIENSAYTSYAKEISRSGHRQLELINRVLKLVQTGSLELEKTRFDLVELVKDCAEILRSEQLHKKIELCLTLPSDPIYIKSDQTITQQIILELFANCIKFSPNNSKIYAYAATDSLGQTVLTTRNPGRIERELGPESDIQEIGDIGDVYSRKKDGIGLGLPLVQKLCNLLGAKFFIENENNNLVQTKVFFTKKNQAPGASERRQAS
jgi:signal transduction histidine kinase